jgi:hypothetical protein
MARLSKEDFAKAVTGAIGDRTDEDSVKFIEDMTDTYNGLEADKNVSETEWEQKYNALNETWSKRYKERFSETIVEEKKKEEDKTIPTTYSDLFS